jgi:hypothetical protein
VSVQAVDQGLRRKRISSPPSSQTSQNVDAYLNAGLLQVSDVARALSRFDAHHDLLRVDGPECINHDLALDGLDRVDDDCDGARIELLERLPRMIKVSSRNERK